MRLQDCERNGVYAYLSFFVSFLFPPSLSSSCPLPFHSPLSSVVSSPPLLSWFQSECNRQIEYHSGELERWKKWKEEIEKRKGGNNNKQATSTTPPSSSTLPKTTPTSSPPLSAASSPPAAAATSTTTAATAKPVDK